MACLTGALRDEIVPPQDQARGTFWKWMALEGASSRHSWAPPTRSIPSPAGAASTTAGPGRDLEGLQREGARLGLRQDPLRDRPDDEGVLWSHSEEKLAGGNAASPGVYDAKDGRCSTPAPQGVQARSTRGRELALGPTGVTISGQPLYSSPEFPVYDRSVLWPPVLVAAKNARLTIVEEKGAGWKLAAQTLDGSGTLWEQALPSEPQRWGLAVDAA